MECARSPRRSSSIPWVFCPIVSSAQPALPGPTRSRCCTRTAALSRSPARLPHPSRPRTEAPSTSSTSRLSISQGATTSKRRASGRSPAFDIASDVYRQPFAVTMLSFYGQRCGTAVQFRHKGDLFAHGECHTEDAYLDFVTGEDSHKASQFGWHDAGDYGKYTINGAFAAGLLLKAWEHFRPGLGRFELELPERGGRDSGSARRGQVRARVAAHHSVRQRCGFTQGDRSENSRR